MVCSIGRVVRAIAESDPKANTENHRIKNAIAAGEMINKQSIQKILETHMVNLSDKKGIIIDGYPRDIKQVTEFEEKVFFVIHIFNIVVNSNETINLFFFLSLLGNFLFCFPHFPFIFSLCTTMYSIVKNRR